MNNFNNCGCNNSCGGGMDCLWLIIMLCCCGKGTNMNCLIPIIVAMCCCGCGSGIGSSCGNDCGHNSGCCR